MHLAPLTHTSATVEQGFSKGSERNVSAVASQMVGGLPVGPHVNPVAREGQTAAPDGQSVELLPDTGLPLKHLSAGQSCSDVSVIHIQFNLLRLSVTCYPCRCCICSCYSIYRRAADSTSRHNGAKLAVRA